MEPSRIIDILAKALAAIDQIIRNVRDDAGGRMQRAADALTAIGVIVDAVKAGDLDKVDADAVETELERLVASIRDNNRAADSAVDDKFGED